MPAIGKTDRNNPSSGLTRTVIGHCADVASSFDALLSRGVSARAFDIAHGTPLCKVQRARLCVLAFLHDAGKACNGFQDRIHKRGRGTSHLAELLAALGMPGPYQRALEQALDLPRLRSWFTDLDAMIYACISHHGSAVSMEHIQEAAPLVSGLWRDIPGYSPISEVRALTQAAFSLYPDALKSAPPITVTPAFEHTFVGALTTADWMGSSDQWHPVTMTPEHRPACARQLLDDTVWCGWHSGAPAQDMLGKYAQTPNDLQNLMLSLPLEQVAIVDAQTGYGKTEAALVWADRLVRRGLVDGLYFALPTRSAATEIHDRVSQIVTGAHPLLAGRVVRAVPGLIDTDPFGGPALPPTYAEGGSPKKAQAAPVAVGTIDQALLSRLDVRHAHMRGFLLQRQLLVVDEVHASDAYMAAIVLDLVQGHVAMGGYVLLLSATLGDSLRARLEGRQALPLPQAIAKPYPLVTTLRPGSAPVHSSVIPPNVPAQGQRTVTVQCHSERWARTEAIAAVKAGKRVLWIRSTVRDALLDARAFRAKGHPVLLHHSRFAADDRKFLDDAVLASIGRKATNLGPVIIVGTQTLEQSLDIDADLLVTDACPADVLLQRIGRLHRHRKNSNPLALVITPGDWDSTVSERGAAVGGDGRGWAWVYSPLQVRASIEWIRAKRTVTVPDEVRAWVETGTHPDSLAALARGYGPRWELMERALRTHQGERTQRADRNLIDRSQSFALALAQGYAPTRIGDGSDNVKVVGALISPFTGQPIAVLPVRGSWLATVPEDTPAIVRGHDPATGLTTIDCGGVVMLYGKDGLHRPRDMR